MDYTIFEYITEIPEVIDAAAWYELAIRSYNLGLTAVWLILALWCINNLFTTFSKFYKRGHE